MLRSARSLAALALLSLPAWGVVGCTTAKLDALRLDAPTVAEASIAGPGVDISNMRGDITIRVDPRAEGISVRPTVRLDKDGPEHFDLDLVTSSVDVTAEVQDRGGLPVLVVTTTSTRDQNEFFVDLNIRIPAADGLRIRSGGGVIRAVGVRGAVDIESVGGPVEVRTPHALTQPVSVSTGGGDIYLMAPPATTGRVRMRAFGGECHLESLSPDARLTEVFSKMTELTAVVNGGENPIELVTTDGKTRMLLLDRPLGRVGISRYRFGN